VAALATGVACDDLGTWGLLSSDSSEGESAERSLGPQSSGPSGQSADEALELVRSRFGVLLEPGQTMLAGSAGDNASGALSAAVRMPDTAEAAVEIAHPSTGVSVSFELLGASAAPAQDVDGHRFFAGGGPVAGVSGQRSHVFLRRTSRGVEDFVQFDAPPAGGELRYRFAPRNVRALRLVGDTLELLDASGSPRIRVKPPYVVDADARRHRASIEVQGCAVDRDGRSPWNRELIELDASSCELSIRYDAKLPHPVIVDPAWEVTAFMSHARTHHTATRLADGTVLVVGGFDETGAAVAEAEILCAEEDLCPGGVASFTVTDSLGEARGAHTATLVGGQVLIAGGRLTRASVTAIASTEVHTVAGGSFADGPAMSVGRFGHTSTLLTNGNVLIVGGEDGVSPSTAQVWNPTTGFTAAVPIAGGHRRGHMAEILNGGRVLIAGGVGGINNAAVSTAELSDATGVTFTATDNMTSTRAWGTATRLEDAAGTVLIVGGTNNTGFYYRTVDLFDPTGSGTFIQQLIQSNKSRAFHAATALSGEGKVLITGGFDGTTIHDDTEVFDIPAGAFVDSLTTTMNQVHNFHTSTLLLTGKAVVIGGGVAGTPLNPGSGAVNLAAASVAEVLARINGEPCDIDGECLSGHCYEPPNGVCCDEQCTDVCSSCFAAEQALPSEAGACKTVLDATPVAPKCDSGVELILECTLGQIEVTNIAPCEPYVCDGDECGIQCDEDDECHPDYFCEIEPENMFEHDCLLKIEDGQGCKRAGECDSGQCVDGVCCENACGGQCQACDVEGSFGNCVQVEGPPHGTDDDFRQPCAGTGAECEGVCGTNPEKCDYDTAAECGDSTCADGVREFGRCSVQQDGACEPSTTQCDPFGCNAAGTTCVIECETSEECAAGAVCLPDGLCAIVEETICDGHTLIKPDQTTTDCSPFLCAGAACLKSCDSIDDCIEGTVCDATGDCIDPPADPPPPEDCAVRSPGRDGRGAPLFAIGVAIAAMAARRSRRQEASR